VGQDSSVLLLVFLLWVNQWRCYNRSTKMHEPVYTLIKNF
jgi:hypothetical protein